MTFFNSKQTLLLLDFFGLFSYNIKSTSWSRWPSGQCFDIWRQFAHGDPSSSPGSRSFASLVSLAPPYNFLSFPRILLNLIKDISIYVNYTYKTHNKFNPIFPKISTPKTPGPFAHLYSSGFQHFLLARSRSSASLETECCWLM